MQLYKKQDGTGFEYCLFQCGIWCMLSCAQMKDWPHRKENEECDLRFCSLLTLSLWSKVMLCCGLSVLIRWVASLLALKGGFPGIFTQKRFVAAVSSKMYMELVEFRGKVQLFHFACTISAFSLSTVPPHLVLWYCFDAQCKWGFKIATLITLLTHTTLLCCARSVVHHA